MSKQFNVLDDENFQKQTKLHLNRLQSLIDDIDNAITPTPSPLSTAGEIPYSVPQPSPAYSASSSTWTTNASDLLPELPLEADEVALLAELAPEALAAALIAYGTYKTGQEIWNHFKKGQNSQGSIAGQPPIEPKTIGHGNTNPYNQRQT